MNVKKREIAPEHLLRTCSTFSKSMMVSVGVSKLGPTQLIFVDSAMKINGAYYRDVLLTQQLLSVVQEISGYFLRASAMLKHVLAIGWTSVSPSVCPSVCHTLVLY